MKDMSIRWGATLPLTLTNDEEGAETATLNLSKDGVLEFTKTVNFVGLVADLSLTALETETLDVGEYDYMVTVVYDDGTVEKYPDTDGCDDCSLPILEICVANDQGES